MKKLLINDDLVRKLNLMIFLKMKMTKILRMMIMMNHVLKELQNLDLILMIMILTSMKIKP